MSPACYRAVVFDFDGVIVQSNSLKKEAFFSIFPPEARRVVNLVLAEHREKSRYEIISLVLAALDSRPEGPAVDSAEVRRYARAYNRLVEEGALKCPLVPGALEALQRLREMSPLFINSATPQEPLRRIVQGRGLSRFFQGVYGAPASKEDNLKAIVAGLGAAGQEVLVVGDGLSDLRSARSLGCDFIGVDNEFGTLRGRAELRPDLVGLAEEIASRSL